MESLPKKCFRYCAGFLVGLLMLAGASPLQAQDGRITFKGQDIFLSGSNVAWVYFDRDIGPGPTPLDKFDEIFTQLSDSSGNAMRLWLHTSGASTPARDGAKVTGPGEGAIKDLKAILDLAESHGVGLQLCLWSFDMLRSGPVADNKEMLESKKLTQTYIDNALVPMVKAVGDHPAVVSWEIFNEPEGMSHRFGFGSVNTRVSMSTIQQFVNLTAGAIHRADPDAKVTNGAWSSKSLWNKPAAKRVESPEPLTESKVAAAQQALSVQSRSEVSREEARDYVQKVQLAEEHNYYTDQRLIKAGGDTLGTLDYYTVHYYEWEKKRLSPFHHDKSYWGLNKPLAVTEFFMGGDDNAIFGVPSQDLYTTLYDRGYAGAMGWQWYNYPNSAEGVENWPPMLRNMQKMGEKHPEAVQLDLGFRLNYFTADPSGVEKGGKSELSWSVSKANTVTIDGETVSAKGTKTVSPTETTTYKLTATGQTNQGQDTTATKEITVTVLPPLKVNRARLQPAIASTNEACCSPKRYAEDAFDGDLNTRWSSAWATAENNNGEPDPNIDDDPGDEWIYVDLGRAYDLHSVALRWETAYGSSYDIETSYDAQTWKPIKEVRDGDGGLDSLTFEQPYPTARYVRMHGLKRATDFGFSIFEFEVYGLVSDQQPPKAALTAPAEGAIVAPGSKVTLTASDTSTTGNTVKQVAFFSDGEQVGIAEENPFSVDLDAQQGRHVVYARLTTESGFQVQTPPNPLYAMNTDDFTRFEAEDADYEGSITEETGGGSNSSGEERSYLSIGKPGTITFDNISVPQAGEYTVIFGYNLNFDSPKSQYVIVNGGDTLTTRFNANPKQWHERGLDVQLQEGQNTIEMEAFWGYMQLDYIGVKDATRLAVGGSPGRQEAKKLSLQANYPNPVRMKTTIPYTVPTTQHVQITVYNALGRRVARLVDTQQTIGKHEAHFDARTLPSGVYFVRLKSGAASQTQRLVVVR